MSVDPSTAEGRSRILLFVGLGMVGVGSFVDMSAVFWAGTVAVVVAFALNTAGKLTHYGNLGIPRADRTKISTTWTLLALTFVALLTNYGYTRYGPGDGSLFWSLAVACVGFGLLHMAAQSKYLPAERVPEGNDDGDA